MALSTRCVQFHGYLHGPRCSVGTVLSAAAMVYHVTIEKRMCAGPLSPAGLAGRGRGAEFHDRCWQAGAAAGVFISVIVGIGWTGVGAGSPNNVMLAVSAGHVHELDVFPRDIRHA